MRRLVGPAAVLLFLAALSAFGQDFRKVTWGMSPEEVMSAEGLQFPG